MKVIVADDSALTRDGVARLLADAGHEVGTAQNAEVLLRELGLTGADAVVVDIRMPPTHTDEGLRAAHAIRRDHPRVGVLVLSHYLESRYAVQLLAEAPRHVGYLLKDRVADVETLLDSLDRVARGECVVDPAIVDRLVRLQQPRGAIASLTGREREVLALIAEGRSNQAIAQRLSVGPKTLEAHVHRIFQKLGIAESSDDNRRVLAVLAYLRDARDAD